MTLRAEKVGLVRGGRAILTSIDLDLAPGRLTVLLGPNGAGKSSLFRLLAGDMAPDSGRVTLDGRDLADWRADRLAQRRAVLPQDTSVGFAFTGREVAAWGARGLPAREAALLAADALAAVEALGFADRPVPRLSGGERRRIHLARALVQTRVAARGNHPPVLLLDEPTAGLDPRHCHIVLKLALAAARDGAAVAAVLHDLDLAARYADEVVLLSAGHLLARGPVESVLRPALVGPLYGVQAVTAPCPAGGRSAARIIDAAFPQAAE